MRVAYLGSQEIGARCLEVVLAGGHDVVGVGTFAAGPHEHWTDDVERIVAERGLPRLSGRRFRTPEAIGELERLRPDILFAIGWRWILPNAVLELPPKGCLGIHGSLLPRLRGFAPVNWALLRDEPRTGPSLFYFDEGMDTGDLVGQRPFDLSDEDDAATVRRRLADASVELLREHLPGLAAGTAPRIAQPQDGATYGERRRPEDGAIDWSKGSREIFNWVRGLTRPYPGAFAFAAGEKVFVWKVRPIEGGRLSPGGIAVAGDKVLAGTGDGAVELLDVSLPGGEGAQGAARAGALLRAAGRFDAEAPDRKALP